MRLHLTAPLLGLLAFTSALSAAAQAPSGEAVEVRLEAHDGRSQFALGDEIQLDLVFRNTTNGSYTVNTTLYGDLADAVEITPSEGWFHWQGQSDHDYSTAAPLTDKEIRVPIVLNEGFVPREPGHYEIRVITRRLTQRSNGNVSAPIGSNSVGIDLVATSAEEESAQLHSILAQIASFTGHTRQDATARSQAFARLASMQGDEALRAKVRFILAEDSDMRRVTWQALASSRNLPLQLSLLEAAWHNPQQLPIYDLASALQETRRLLRGQTQPGWQLMVAAHSSEEQTIAAKEHLEDMEALIRSLPQRSGKSRTYAAYYILEDRAVPPAEIAAVRPIALEELPHMDDIAQHMLLETAWPAIRDPALEQPLRNMLEHNPSDKDALERIIELDPRESKSYVIRAICNPKSIVPLKSIGDLPEATLPEVDACLGGLLRTPPARPYDLNWNTRASYAARFASPAVLPAVREGWKLPSQDGPVLALLLRYSPTEAVERIKATPVSQAQTLFYEIDTIFTARHANYPTEFTSWLRQLVKDGPDVQAGQAAYRLSHFGSPDDCFLIEQRLQQVRAQWSSRASEFATADLNSDAGHARQLESELMSDLRSATQWSITNEEAVQLAQGCLSDQCRIYGHPCVDVPVSQSR